MTDDGKIKIYLATDFFSNATKEWTEKVAQNLEKNFPEVILYVPHRNAAINDKKNNDAVITDIGIYEADTEELLSSDILVCCIDGNGIDPGVASEIGLVAGYNEIQASKYKPVIPIFGLYTDCRQYGTGDNHYYINLYTKGAIRVWGWLTDSEEELVDRIDEWITVVQMPQIESDNVILEDIHNYGKNLPLIEGEGKCTPEELEILKSVFGEENLRHALELLQ